MSKDEKVPDWFLWAWEHFPGILMVCVLLGTIVVGGAVYVESRLSDIEERLNFSPPRSYTPPDLDSYDAKETTSEQLENQHLVYVPVYSHIYYRGGSPYPLETTLSIRNVDPNRAIYVESVDYFNTTGDLEKQHVDRLIKLAPLQTIEFLIENRDSSGGSGANFLVRWGSVEEVDRPMIETVMVGTIGMQGIGFARSGREITDAPPGDR